MKFSIPTEADTRRIAREFAASLKPHDAVLLHGALGMGKTVFARALIQALIGRGETVKSPSFTLLETYEYEGGAISHYDFYRIKSEDELFELDLEDSLRRNLTIIEWPEIAADIVDSAARPIHVYFSEKDGARYIEITEPTR
ncbi:MAG: tRNA (adenosine(37)-N6)-threonylcarbamoyltransferase complex ATPase subunit type 1 TsaE [Rickettsiales bacterium]|jgi:tRNA threonylcarbamoyl adenosine modification protein YjeE|nr:tRNA (adenosine(37)-N6)-threonylcarbamoyltransferase complex ATPase subunit type 1 TsaE [Rickettsiales bacterium]